MKNKENSTIKLKLKKQKIPVNYFQVNIVIGIIFIVIYRNSSTFCKRLINIEANETESFLSKYLEFMIFYLGQSIQE